ncbi:DUF4870 domain-containing protein [Nodosilinea sp. E11]|uniref:DUF4870 domain-containing protein n=1 Tax=Nodosilinea sp. E11 TaxID=3037479 RepID=UPI0029351C05|nr:DUF4870 domain-containing protein [Nodosilinea sp. E11]WOD38428.1 DUF4870 domain-containing protein [Nodosilinea sp. E11]
MTLPLSTLIDRARQGDACAIAQLITRSLANQGVVARGQWQGTQLIFDLEADRPVAQRQVVPHICRGLERLELTCPIDTVSVIARRTDQAAIDWRESFSLQTGVGLAVAGPEPSDAPEDPVLSDRRRPDRDSSASGSPVPFSVPPSLLPPDRVVSTFHAETTESDTPAPPAPNPDLKPSALSGKTLAALMHLTPLLSYLVVGSQWLGGWPLFWGGSFLLPWRVVAPLVLVLLPGLASRPGYADMQNQAKAALNFQLTLLIAWVVTIALMFVLVGFLLVVPLALIEIVSCIVAAVRASEGKAARYAVAIRFVR